MTIRTKLTVLSATGAAMLAAMAGIQFWVTTATERQSKSARLAQAQVLALTTIEEGLTQEMKEELEAIAASEEATMAREEIEPHRRQVHAAIDQLAQSTQEEARHLGQSDRPREVIQLEQDIRRATAEIETEIDRILGDKGIVPHDMATLPHEMFVTHVKMFDRRLAQLIDPAVARALTEAARAEQLQASYSNRARDLALAPPLFGTAVLVFLAQQILRPLLRHLAMLIQATQRITQGDLSTSVPMLEKDELGELASSFNVMLDGLRELDVARARLAKAAADLDRSNHELESFAQVVSHDLRAPLRALSNYSRFLEEDYAHAFDAEGKQYVEGIAKNAVRMDALVVGLLEYARIGRVEAEPMNVHVGDLLERVVTTLGLREKADVALPNDPPSIWGRALRLEQVFSNLMDNAVKYQRKGMRPQVTVEWADRADCWEFAVRDNGIGIDLKHKDKLFGMFQRLHTHDEYEGTGIGLAIVKKAVEEHGGKIWVESAPGQGSVFRFTIAKPEKDGPRQAA